MFDVPTAVQVKEGSTFSDITDNLFIVRGHYHNVLIKSKTQNGMYFDNEWKETPKNSYNLQRACISHFCVNVPWKLSVSIVFP
jgi:hypothetical protein